VSRGRKWLRRLLWLGAGVVAASLVVWAVLWLLILHWVARPPALPAEAARPRPVVQVRGDRTYIGKSWFGRREGLPVLYLTGTPFEMGYANSALTGKIAQRQEESMLKLLHRVAPYRWTQFLLKFLVTYKDRHLPEYVIQEQQLELLGLTAGAPDPHPEVGPVYHRLLNYHAAQDISYMMMNSPLIRRGCTAFGAWGPETQGGHLLTGRNFDWEADPVFDEDRIVVICEPSAGIPFISLSWAGMVGCVSGMNREGLSITVNGAPSHLPNDIATPTCLVAREVLQHARNLQQATDIIRRRQVFVSALFLVGSRKDGRFIVVEKTPERMAVREADGQSYLVCANHYLTSELKDDPLNLQFQRLDTSVSRFDRMKELLESSAGKLDAAQTAALLRDRRLPGGGFPGNGHRGSLNPLIATHAVIMDLTDGIYWAAAPPHQLGRFVAFDVQDPERALPERMVAEDPMLASGEYQRFLAARAELSEGWQAVRKGNYALAADCARQAETNNPGFYRNAWLLAEGLAGQGQAKPAAAACNEALEGKPALAGERQKIEKLAAEIAKRQQP
jgi:isopenicillin-N N-acyltransferase like protein